MFALSLGACSGGSSAPSPSPPLTYTLSGTVTGPVGGLSDAIVEIMDGPNTGRQTKTALGGFYTLADLAASTFHLRTSAAQSLSDTRPVALVGSMTLDIRLRQPVLQGFDPLAFRFDARGFELTGHIRNIGDACATHVRGTITLQSTDTRVPPLNESLSWALPQEIRLAPGATNVYSACCISRDWADRDGRYFLAFELDAVECP